MGRFLFTVWPFAGHVHPAIAIGHALRRRGHSVAFYTGGSVSALLEGEGFRCFPFVKLGEEQVTDLLSSAFPYSTSMLDKLGRAREIQKSFREWLVDTIPQQVEDLSAVLATWRPDVIVCDSAFWGPILVLAETERIPVAALSITAACILPGPDAPAWGQGLPRPRNALMRARSAVERSLIARLSAGFLSHVNATRARYRLDPISCSVTEYAGRMQLYLVPSTRLYDYDRHDLPPSVKYVGPCLWDKPNTVPPPPWLSEIRDDRPLVYVTEATIGKSDPFLLRAAARALRNQPLQVIMTTGKQRDPSSMDLPAGASNIRVERYVPQSDVLPRARVVVTLGGSGGVLAALKSGVPLIVVPTEWDRPENAQRVVEAGAGLRIAATQCTPERLRAAVCRVLNEPQFRQNALRLAADIERYDGPVCAAGHLEGMVVNLARPALTLGGSV